MHPEKILSELKYGSENLPEFLEIRPKIVGILQISKSPKIPEILKSGVRYSTSPKRVICPS